MENNSQAQNHIDLRDHDLLVRLDTKMDGLNVKVDDIKTNSEARLNKLEDSKLDRNDFDDAMKKNQLEHANFVSKEAFKALIDKVAFTQWIVVSACGLVITTVIVVALYQLFHVTPQ